jgi:hypothetical protein
VSGVAFAADNPVAILRTSAAGVTVNEKAAVNSQALYSDDFIQTGKNASARIESTGSSVVISAETIVQFEGDELVLDHGVLSVNTSVGLRVRVGCLTVTPVNETNWTHYEVSDRDGKMTVSALKNDAYINERSKNPKEAKQPERSGHEMVREGEQKSREDKCGGGYVKSSATTPGVGPILNSPYARLIGAGAIGIVTCFALCKNDDPLSPSMP